MVAAPPKPQGPMFDSTQIQSRPSLPYPPARGTDIVPLFAWSLALLFVVSGWFLLGPGL